MNDNLYLSGVIIEKLEADTPAVLASIVSMEGSTPRESGSKMVVVPGGVFYGTVGGSLIEATAIRESANVLAEKRSKFMDFDLTGTDTSSDGMICGGRAVLLLDYFTPSAGNIELFRQMNSFISQGNNFHLVTGFTESGNTIEITGHCLLFLSGRTIGDRILSETDIPGIQEELHNISSTTVLSAGGKQFIIDPIRKLKTLFSFGAGHVAVPTAHIASMVGFKVVVVDDREEFACKERFPDADEIHVIKDFSNAFEGLEIDKDSFIIIVTRGHRFDREVLEQAIKTGAGYIGMISSRNKRDAVYRALIARGIATKDELERVHSPIGLNIGGETPEEIAVSIVAELICEREKQGK